MLVHSPVDASESFPASIEIIGILDVGISLAKVTEAGPYFQIGSDAITGIQLNQYFRYFRYDIAGSIDTRFRSVAEDHTGFVFFILGALVSEQEMKSKSFERLDDSIRGPADGFDVVAQSRSLNVGRIIRINQVQCRIVVCLADIREQGSQTDPRIVEIDTCTAQRNGDFIDVRQLGRGEVGQVGSLCIVSEVGCKSKLFGHLVSGCRRKSHVQPIVAVGARGDGGTIGSQCTDMIVGKATHRFAFVVVDS